MSGAPSSPLLPDVFSSSSSPLTATPPSSLPPRRTLETSREGQAWIPVVSTGGQPRSLDTVSEKSETSRSNSNAGLPGAQSVHATQMAFSLPATPPHSPEPTPAPQPRHQGLLDRTRAHRPAHLNFDAFAAAGSNDRPSFSLSAATPTFNPVVGGGSSTTTTPTNTPTRQAVNPRVSHLKHKSREFASLPCTPLRSLDRFSTSTTAGEGQEDGAGGGAGKAAWTWPLKSANSILVDRANLDSGRNERGPQASPTKQGSTRQGGAPGEEVRELATRYVLVEGLERTATEDDLRNLLISHCKGLTLRGCYTAVLRSHGLVVLVFNDVRHALAAVRLFSPDSTRTPLYPPHEASLEARCITRESFEELHPGPSPIPLLSRSEAVLVFTLRGPTSTPYFTPLPLLASFGEVRSLKVVEEHLHVVEYWDDSSAQQACEVLDGRETGGVRFGCSFEPGVASIDLEPVNPYPPQHDPVTATYSSSPPSTSFNPAAAPFSPYSAPLLPSPLYSPYLTEYSPVSTLPAGVPFSSRDVNSLCGQDGYGTGGQGYPAAGRDQGDGRSGQAWESLYVSTHSTSATPHPSSLPASPASSAFFAAPPGLPSSPAPPPGSASPRSATFPPSVHGSAHGGGGGGRGKHKHHRSRLSDDFGIVRDDKIPSGNVLNFERIEQGLDMRTTLMLKNIPNKLKDWEVMAFIEEVVGRAFDFFYLRCDYSNDCNVGYGFVNFTSTTALLAFAKARLGTRWNMCGSDKLCIMSFANIQGKASLITHFKNSSVLDQGESRRPKLFVTSGPNAGQPEPFPMCDDPIRKARSAANAQNVGLFPSQKPVFKVAQAFKGLSI
ncbi:hypothetical protein JCM8547_006850 [Rhodosporidiobolus lusitaniae]